MASQTVAELMTPDPVTVASTAPVTDAARLMRERHIGEVVVVEDGQVCGVVTDRDLVVRVLADQRDPARTRVADVCSADLIVVHPETTSDEAVRLMREAAVRRLPVVDEGGRPVGALSIGDLAVTRDPDSALADISGAPPNT